MLTSIKNHSCEVVVYLYGMNNYLVKWVILWSFSENIFFWCFVLFACLYFTHSIQLQYNFFFLFLFNKQNPRNSVIFYLFRTWRYLFRKRLLKVTDNFHKKVKSMILPISSIIVDVINNTKQSYKSTKMKIFRIMKIF